MRAPRICTCGRKVEAGTRCQCRAAFDAARKARFDAKRPSAAARGYDGAWFKARLSFLKQHPRCHRCGALATVVHHSTPHRGDREIFWDTSRWLPACQPCHDGPLQAAEKAKGGRFASRLCTSVLPRDGRQRAALSHPGASHQLSPAPLTGARTSTRHTLEFSFPKDDPWR